MSLEILRNLGVSRRQFDDPLFKEGNHICQKLFEKRAVVDLDDEELLHTKLNQFCCSVPGCVQTFDCIAAFEDHYNSHHQYTCITCKKHLPSPQLLELHIMERHDPFFQVLAAKQAMYCCLMESCSETFMDTQARRVHCKKVHHFPAHFRFDEWITHPKSSNRKSSNSSTMDDMETEACNTSAGTCTADPKESKMEAGSGDASPSPSGSSGYKFSYRVPTNFSFGHGASRGFMHRGRGRGRGRKQQTKGVSITGVVRDTATDVSKMDLSDLEAALPPPSPSPSHLIASEPKK